MGNELDVRPLSWVARFADVLMIPIMYFVSGTTRELPQQTHRWNNTPLTHNQIAHLSAEMTVFCKGIGEADGIGSRVRSRGVLLFHMPILGGWRDYVVIQPDEGVRKWHIGWTTADAVGVSRIVLREHVWHGRVRMLIGQKDVSFFGICSKSHKQIGIRQVGAGRIGDHGQHSRVPLL